MHTHNTIILCPQAIGGYDTKPSYKELEALIAKGREAKLEVRSGSVAGCCSVSFLVLACLPGLRLVAVQQLSAITQSNTHLIAITSPTQIFEVAKQASSLDLEAARARGAPEADSQSAEAAAASYPSLEQLAALESDPKAVRRLLVSLGLPGSGTPAKLQARAVAVAEALARGDSFEEALAVARKLR